MTRIQKLEKKVFLIVISVLKNHICDLIQQVELSDFKDENGMALKNNKAYLELKADVEGFNE